MLSDEQKKIRALFHALINADEKAFPAKGSKIDAPNERGVYLIYAPNHCVAHVGSTPRAKGGLKQRLQDHLQGRSSFTAAYFAKSKQRHGTQLKGRYSFRCLPVSGGRQRALLEAFAIGTLCPRHIGHGKRADKAGLG
jgi:hypothetical protein